MKKILVTGASGFVGSRLICELYQQYEIYAISRKKRSSKEINWLTWDELDQLPKDLYMVVNLMGENIAGFLWTKNQRKKILDSREKQGNFLIDQLKQNNVKIENWIQASAIGYYGKKEIINDESEKKGSGFLADVCQKWEEVSNHSYLDKTKKSIVRISLVLDESGGLLDRIKLIFKLGLGGRLGSGDQKMSWISLGDLVSLFKYLIDNPQEDIFNAVAPEGMDNKKFTKALSSYYKMPAIFPVPEFMLKTLLGDLSSLLLDSQEVKSKNLSTLEFKFKHSSIDKLLKR